MKATEVLLEMSVKRSKAEQIFGGIDTEFNLHLLKLMGCVASEESRNHWKKELRTWAAKLSIITLKDNDRPVPYKDVYDWLYAETFEGTRELRNVEALLNLLAQDHQRSDLPAANISIRLKTFHQAFARRISKNDAGYDLINAL